MAQPHQPTTREVRLFRNNRSQAVRIPVEFELPGERVLIRREGDKLIIEPVRTSSGLLDLLAKWDPIEEDFPAIEDKPVAPEDIF